jgi:hypothetical protein
LASALGTLARRNIRDLAYRKRYESLHARDRLECTRYRKRSRMMLLLRDVARQSEVSRLGARVQLWKERRIIYKRFENPSRQIRRASTFTSRSIEECRINYSFDKEDLPRIVHALRLHEVIRTPGRWCFARRRPSHTHVQIRISSSPSEHRRIHRWYCQCADQAIYLGRMTFSDACILNANGICCRVSRGAASRWHDRRSVWPCTWVKT